MAIALALLDAVLGIGMRAWGGADSGVRLAVLGDRLVVSEFLAYSSPPMGTMIAPGMIVTNLNGQTILELPAEVYATPLPTPDPVTGAEPLPVAIGVEPATPTLVVDPALLPALAGGPVRSLYAVAPDVLATWSPSRSDGVWWAVPWGFDISALTWGVGLLVLALAAWWLAAGRSGETLRSAAGPVAAAIAAPLILWPLEASGSPIGVAVYSVLVPVSALPMALALGRLADPRVEQLVSVAGAGACAAGAVALGLLLSPGGLWAAQSQVLVISLLVGGVAFVPALAAAGAQRATQAGGAAAERRVVAGAGLVAFGAMPFFAFQSAAGPFPVALPVWLLIATIANRFTLRPLSRLAGRANLQRDLVVAATEAERARVAADIHDDALQDLTLLVRRLDAAGDAEGAEIARGVADRLRAICGDLRLPILDDLGVGPALDWLVLRIERIAGGPVRLERIEGPRPPAAVELALFRIAQEALANAVKHGATPVVVRYRAVEGAVSLSVDDSGPGIKPDAAERAASDGRYGLLAMAQRAEAIGAILDVRPWPGGGTHVQVEWRAG